LSEEECIFLEDAGFHPVLLRTNILRSETAGMYALSAIQTIMTEKKNY
jgi:16S rRNA (uracil1498-N3)-methyltransferase